jgi:type 1 glutamine amidotransferase
MSTNFRLKTLCLGLLALILVFLQSVDSQAQSQFRALVFSKTKGFRHQSIPDGVMAIKQLASKHRFQVYTTEDEAEFTKEKLEKYDVIILMSTTGTIFNEEQKAAFQEFVRSGKGVVGIHSATDTEYDWKWYNDLIGAQFAYHPHQQTARLKVVNRNHPSTYHLQENWLMTDEWYAFKNFNKNVNVLVKLDETSYDVGQRNGESMGMVDHPISWYHVYDGGRVFYTGLGHTDEAFKDESFLTHILGGIWYAALGRPF